MRVAGDADHRELAARDLDRMRAFGLTLPEIVNAISSGNSNVGGRTINIGEQSVNVRGLGVIGSLSDIGNIVLTQQGSVPVLLSDEWAMVARFHGDLEIRDRLNDLFSGRRELGGAVDPDDDIA